MLNSFLTKAFFKLLASTKTKRLKLENNNIGLANHSLENKPNSDEQQFC